MKQLLQHLGSGELEIAEVPLPEPRPGHLLIRSRRSLISPGTERMLVDFGKANLLQKAMRQPQRVRQVLDKMRTDGIASTLEAVKSKLDAPIPLGYSNAGVVAAVGDGVEGFAVGDRVVSNGPHAEYVQVPERLCCAIPDGVDDDAAAFTVLGAIALHGARLARPTLGEVFGVIGLGPIGLLAVQILRGHGCRVLAFDLDARRVELAEVLGAEAMDLSAGGDPLERARLFSRGRGLDAVLLTASTSSSDPVRTAARACRKRGRIVLVGVTGLELDRADFYEKELSFQVSCSYGPGRYDPDYEERGRDYPVGYVRWTEQRNFEAFLDLLASGSVSTDLLRTAGYPFEKAAEAYARLSEGGDTLGLMLEYAAEPEDATDARAVELPGAARATAATAATTTGGGAAVCGFVGAGNYASRILMPAFRAADATLKTVATLGGSAGVVAGRKHGFAQAVTGTDALFDDTAIDTVVVATRHDSHAALAARALATGKHAFVEKPLALDSEGLDAVRDAWRASRTGDAGAGPLLTVGFNRRFSPAGREVRRLLAAREGAAAFVATVNAGAIPADHWTQDPAVGGGRILGEACHFVDLLRFFAGSPIVAQEARAFGRAAADPTREDKATLLLEFADGSIGTIHYLANGSRAFPKERIEVFSGGGVLQIDNFRALRAWSWPGARTRRRFKQDKGQAACAAAFVRAVRAGGPPPIPFEELDEVARVTIDLAERIRRR